MFAKTTIYIGQDRLVFVVLICFAEKNAFEITKSCTTDCSKINDDDQ